MTKMAWLPTYTYLLAASLLLAPTLAAVCPDSCVCSTTRDGLHRITCSNLLKLYKYTLRQKNLNINIVDLSHNNITKISHELDRLTEMVTLDLSTNGLTSLNKFLQSTKKLVHLNLAHNRLQRLSITDLPISISSLDLSGNLLKDVPSDLGHLPSLEHLLLEGNPLHCSCSNIISRNHLLASNIYIDDVKCHSPVHLKDRSWLELKTKEICKFLKSNNIHVMMEDQSLNAVHVGKETTALKSMPFVANNKLDDGEIIHNTDLIEDDDTLQFVRVKRYPSTLSNDIEDSDKAEKEETLDKNNEELLNTNINPVEDLIEDSVEGSGFSSSLDTDFKDETTSILETSKSAVNHSSIDSAHELLKSDTESILKIKDFKSDELIIESNDQIESIGVTSLKPDEVSTDLTHVTPNLDFKNLTESIPEATTPKIDDLRSESDSNSNDKIENVLEITTTKTDEVSTDLIDSQAVLDSANHTENISEIATSKADELSSGSDGISNSNDLLENIIDITTKATEVSTDVITNSDSVTSQENIQEINKSKAEELLSASERILNFGEQNESTVDISTTDSIHKLFNIDSERTTEYIPGIIVHEIESSTEINNILNSYDRTEGIPDTTPSLINDLNNESLDRMYVSEELLDAHNINKSDDTIEGSGEGSGFDGFEEYTQNIPESTTPIIEELSPDPVHKIFEDEEETTEFDYRIPDPPSVYQGGLDWNKKTTSEVVPTVSISPEVTRDTTVSEQIRVTQASEVLGQAPSGEENVVPHKTGTYVCIALIIILLVGLIGFAITKGQMRKRRDQRLLRQQRRDVEKASKEMVDMNKSLLGKPAVVGNPDERKINGKYELVPTHESHQKKGENENVANGIKHENELARTDSPRDTNQNKSSSIDNNLTNQNQVQQQETSFDSEPGITSSRKDTNSLSSEDIFVPINDDDNPRLSSNIDLDVSQPLINGDPIVDSDYLSPSREYVPVYSPDMGRVRIKMTETPKPKTPVLVTRSRSNAGDIIITPTLDGNASKSTT